MYKYDRNANVFVVSTPPPPPPRWQYKITIGHVKVLMISTETGGNEMTVLCTPWQWYCCTVHGPRGTRILVTIHLLWVRDHFPANTRRWPNVGLIMYHSDCLRRWLNFKTALGRCLALAWFTMWKQSHLDIKTSAYLHNPSTPSSPHPQPSTLDLRPTSPSTPKPSTLDPQPPRPTTTTK